MSHAYVYDRSASKKPANLSINSDLLAKARGLKLNLSATLERALAEDVRKAEQQRWRESNRQAIEAANRFCEDEGLFADGHPTL